MPEVVFGKKFENELKKIIGKDQQLKKLIKKQIEILSVNPNHNSLRLHKLSGVNNWSVSINKSIRIIISIRGKYILCTEIGKHEDVY
jgi:mRNA-degrading endonuclease YafQ of YafQ-DinJ toxin-antitoxin module